MEAITRRSQAGMPHAPPGFFLPMEWEQMWLLNSKFRSHFQNLGAIFLKTTRIHPNMLLQLRRRRLFIYLAPYNALICGLNSAAADFFDLLATLQV